MHFVFCWGAVARAAVDVEDVGVVDLPVWDLHTPADWAAADIAACAVAAAAEDAVDIAAVGLSVVDFANMDFAAAVVVMDEDLLHTCPVVDVDIVVVVMAMMDRPEAKVHHLCHLLDYYYSYFPKVAVPVVMIAALDEPATQIATVHKHLLAQDIAVAVLAE